MGRVLQPDSARASERGEKDAVATEDQVSDAGDGLDLKRDGRLEGSDVAWVDAKKFAGARSLTMSSPESSSHAMPWPEIFWRRKPSPPKMPAPRDCWKPTPSSMPAVAQRKPWRWTRYSWPGATSTGTMWPGTRVAKATSPGAPMARYSVMKREPPPATRRMAPKKPPPPACWVWVVIGRRRTSRRVHRPRR